MKLNIQNTNTLMKTNYLASILSLLIILSACSGAEEIPQETEELVKTVNVRTESISPSEFNSFVRVVGTVETSDDILISAEVTGKVLRYNIEEGEAVRAGQTILKIDDAKLKQEAVRLEAITAQARENYERLEKIYKEEGIGSEIDYLNAKYAYEQSASSLESIKIDLENTSIKAPFSGVVEEIMYEVGEMVSPGAPAVRLIGSENFKITAGVPARYANAIKQGDQVEIWFDTQDVDTLKQRITFVGNSINPQNRTFRIEIDMTKQVGMKVDMIANIRLKTLQQNDVIVVSEEFIYSKDGRYVSYVLGENEEGKEVAVEKEVKLGPSYKSNVVVESGLEPGEELITIGSAFLNNGMRINVVESQSALAAQ
ncbi:MAG: efflux RND transporter periplasmic adaptor subunit [Balneolaceae bacterium]|nr:efflux RND transporter periplasmic adaptor subunit [Balneolaceae bacterium]